MASLKRWICTRVASEAFFKASMASSVTLLAVCKLAVNIACKASNI